MILPSFKNRYSTRKLDASQEKTPSNARFLDYSWALRRPKIFQNTLLKKLREYFLKSENAKKSIRHVLFSNHSFSPKLRLNFIHHGFNQQLDCKQLFDHCIFALLIACNGLPDSTPDTSRVFNSCFCLQLKGF